MNNMYTIEVGFIPVCTSCGEEFSTSGTQSDPNHKPSGLFDKDNPYERRIQRVFVNPGQCGCWIHKNDELNLTERMQAKIDANHSGG